MADFEWLSKARRYRNVSTGRFVSAASSTALRDDLVVRLQSETSELAAKLADGRLSVQDWEREMQRAVREINTVQWAFGRGGRNAMAAEDRAALAETIRAQYDFLRSFALQIAEGELTAAQVAARAQLYNASSTQAYERGRASAWGVELPHHPGDGSTPCKANCRCTLRYKDTGSTIEVTWVLRAGESCSGCRERAASWSPLVVAKPSNGRVARLYRAVA